MKIHLKYSLLFIILNFVCLNAASQAYTEEELQTRISEIIENSNDINNPDQVSSVLNSRFFSVENFKSYIGSPMAEQYVKELFFGSECSSDDLQGMLSFLKKYSKGNTKYSAMEKAAYLSAIQVYARELAITESTIREEEYQEILREENLRRIKESKNDQNLSNSLLEFIDYYCSLAHEDYYINGINTLLELGINPRKISGIQKVDPNFLQHTIERYAEDYIKRNPDVETISSSEKLDFDNIDSFATYMRQYLYTDLTKAVAAYNSFVITDYFQLIKASSLERVVNNCNELLLLLTNRETRTDNHTVEWVIDQSYNWVNKYQINYEYRDGIFYPEGKILIHSVKNQNHNHTGDNYVENTFDVTYTGFVKDGILTDLTVQGIFQEWTKNYNAGKGYEPFTAVIKINEAPAIIKKETTVKSIEDIIGMNYSVFEILEFLKKDKNYAEKMKKIAYEYAKDPEAFIYSFINGDIFMSDHPEIINQPYIHDIDTSRFF